MSKFVVVMFPDEVMINQGTRTLGDLRANGGIKLYASAVAARDSNGKPSVRELTDEGIGGTAVGALIGGLAGLPAGPIGVAIGAAGGAALGISADLLEQGDEVKFAEKISRELAPGGKAIVAEIDEDAVASFEAMMNAIGGTVVRK